MQTLPLAKTITTTPTLFVNQRLENQLLLLCCRTEMSTQQVEQALQLLQSQPNLDWSYLLELAQRHSLLPLLYLQLQAHFAEVVSATFLEQLEREYKANAYKNIKFSRELGHLLSVFKANHIAVLTFKGPILGDIAYGDYTLRQFMDLDLLVHEEDVFKTKQLLIEQGYKSRFKLNPAQQASYLRLGSEQDFWHRSKQITVDLHWSIMPKHFSFSPASALIWENCCELELDNQNVQTLTLENLLLFLCAHGAKHNWESLGLVCDIAELLRRNPNINWGYIKQNVGKLGTGRMLRLGLYLAHTLLDAPLPPTILATVQADPTMYSLAQDVYSYMFSDLVVAKAQNQADESWLYHVGKRYKDRIIAWFARDRVYQGSMERWQDRLLFWADVIIPTPLELEAFPLPSQLFFLYYPLRPLRLTAKYLSGKYRRSDLV